MGQSTGWRPSRYVALVVVVALHSAFLAVVMKTTRMRIALASADEPVEVLFLPPADTPKIRVKQFRPLRLSGETDIPAALPVIDSVPSSMSPAGLESDGSGPGVDWKAEARRALKAFEIRSGQPPSDNSLSVSPAEEAWWPQARHRAGARYKTANGDWIVWINSSCYQVATSASSTVTPGAMPPQTVCLGEASTPRGGRLD